jgi:fructose-bisphosphate aldolase class 1
VPASGANEELPTAYRLLPTTGHEDLAWFTRTAAELAALEAEAQARADERGPRGRRFARLRTVIEDALLQARQGVHEARHGQYELAERSRQ